MSKRRRWGVERLESRDLPSVTPMIVNSQARSARAAALIAGVSPGFDVGGGTPATTSTDGRQLTPHELTRQHFYATAYGPVQVGPPRYTDEARQFRIAGKASSSFFVRGNIQMALFTPADPAQGRVVGKASLYSTNVTQTGSTLALNLVGDPSSVDRFGRPTQLTWTLNPDGLGGAFSDSTSPGGTLEIRYRGNVAVMIFNGLIDTTGVMNVLATPSHVNL